MPEYGPENLNAPEENNLYSDDDDMIADLLRREWTLPEEWTPMISTDREDLVANASNSVGYIFVYPVSFYPSISSTDYSCAQVTAYLALEVSCRFKDWIKPIVREAERILIAYRRAGPQYLNGYPWFEIIDRVVDNNTIGAYHVTLNIKLQNYAKHYLQAGFGTEINEQLNNL